MPDEFYFSMQWRILRRRVLSVYTACLRCNSTYKLEVDHIKPRSRYPELSLVYENLQVLCQRCNSEKSDKHETNYIEKRNSLNTIRNLTRADAEIFVDGLRKKKILIRRAEKGLNLKN